MAMSGKFKCIINQDFVGVENKSPDLLDIARESRAHLNETAEEQWQLRETFLFTTSASLVFWMMLVEVLHFVAGL